MAENKTLEHLPEVRAAVAALSPEARKLLAAVQASPFKLTAPEQFKEFAANIDYFVFESNIHDLNDLGWRCLAQQSTLFRLASTPCRRNRAILRNTDIFLSPATSGSMNALRSRRKSPPSGNGWNRARRNVRRKIRRSLIRKNLRRNYK